MSPADLATIVLQLSGVSLTLIGAYGLHRFGDTFSRMHAATKPVTLGLLLVVAGAALQSSDAGDVFKIALAVGLQLLTAPLGMHLLGRAAHASGRLDSEATLDEYASDPDATGVRAPTGPPGTAGPPTTT
jgi:multicomponent Na+:H+ antiporter subunit G